MAKYKAVSWNENDDITAEDMQQMSDNITYVKDNMLRGKVISGSTVNGGIKVLAGRVSVAKGKVTSRRMRVNFGGFFSSSCYPICTATMASTYERDFNLTVQGLSGIQPDSAGMDIIYSAPKTNKSIDRNMWVNYICVGY